MIILNGYRVEPTIFPDGTSQVWHIPSKHIRKNGKPNQVEWRFESEAELFHLQQLKCLLDRMGGGSVVLRMDYLPYARQDKPIDNDACFALHPFADSLNAMCFALVECVDAHNIAEALGWIDNFENRSPEPYIEKAIKAIRPDALAFPDDGAQKRYGEMFPNISHITGKKKRTARTGMLTYMGLTGNPCGHNVLIVDDICDGGMTFILLANLLYEKGVKQIHLYVTHGIFSKGLVPLRDAGIQRIFTMRGEVR